MAGSSLTWKLLAIVIIFVQKSYAFFDREGLMSSTSRNTLRHRPIR
jgi:hypothetical protein